MSCVYISEPLCYYENIRTNLKCNHNKMDIIGYIRPLSRSGEIGPKTSCLNNCVIGRDSDCYIKIPSYDVSKKHCIITGNEHGQCYIRNLTTKYPTLLNGVVLGSYKTELRHDDMITIGDTHLRWEYVKESQLCNNKYDSIRMPSFDIFKMQRNRVTNRARNYTSPMSIGTRVKLSLTKFNPENNNNPVQYIDRIRPKPRTHASTRHCDYPYSKRNFASHITASSDPRIKPEKLSLISSEVKRKLETDLCFDERDIKKMKLSYSPVATNRKKLCHDMLSRKRIWKRRGRNNKNWSDKTSQNALRIELGQNDVLAVFHENSHVDYPRGNSFHVSEMLDVNAESLPKNTTPLKSVNLPQTSNANLGNIRTPGKYVKLSSTSVVEHNRYVENPTSKLGITSSEVKPMPAVVANPNVPLSLPIKIRNKRLKSIKESVNESILISTDKVAKRRLKSDKDETAVKKVKISSSPKVQKGRKKKNNAPVLRHDKAVRKQLRDRRGRRSARIRCV